MKELKIDVKRIENVIMLKTVQIDESLEGEEVEISKRLNRFKLITNCFNDIGTNGVFLDSVNKGAKNIYGCRCFDSIKVAVEIENKILKCVKEYNASIKHKYSFENGEMYWFIDDTGEVNVDKWEDQDIDIYRYNTGNAIKTEGEAERKLEIMNFIYEHEYKFTEEEWNDRGIYKYFIYVEFANGKAELDYSCNSLIRKAKYYFKDHATLRKVINFIGADDYIKYVC